MDLLVGDLRGLEGCAYFGSYEVGCVGMLVDGGRVVRKLWLV